MTVIEEADGCNAANTANKGSSMGAYETRKRNAAILAGQYTATKRAMEVVSIITATVFLVLTAYNIYGHVTHENAWVLGVALMLAMVLSDLFSGLVHWGADTWGSLETPLLGKTIIRSFREHHLDPLAITRHDFIEASGDNHMAIALPLMLLAFTPIERGNNVELFMIVFLACTCFWVCLTNEFHKWAHEPKVSPIIQFLQENFIILSRRNHQIHHHNPFDRYYCITTGWLNPLLGSIGFWKRMESMITLTTGAKPREDDRYWTAQ
jgi:ubiquitin-conjugating enzyme E2 variant